MKYKLTNNKKKFEGVTLYQIKAIKDFSNVRAGDLGGWIEKESNLSQKGNCWVYGNAEISGDCVIFGNAKIFGNAWIKRNFGFN